MYLKDVVPVEKMAYVYVVVFVLALLMCIIFVAVDSVFVHEVCCLCCTLFR